jgi:hypothetical protein
MKQLTTYLLALFPIFLISCKDDVKPESYPVVLEFDHRVGPQELVASATYTNAHGEDFTVSAFNYFISNISLKKSDGSVVTFPDHYFLIRQDQDDSQKVQLQNVPKGDYTEIAFLVGVDSAKTKAPAAQRTGALDEFGAAADMNWGWNTGYIFMKLEGTSPEVDLNSAGIRKFEYHIGGYLAPYVNSRIVTLPLPGKATVRNSKNPAIHINTDVAKIFSATSPVKLAETSVVHMPVSGVTLANNFSGMFVVDSVDND